MGNKRQYWPSHIPIPIRFRPKIFEFTLVQCHKMQLQYHRASITNGLFVFFLEFAMTNSPTPCPVEANTLQTHANLLPPFATDKSQMPTSGHGIVIYSRFSNIANSQNAAIFFDQLCFIASDLWMQCQRQEVTPSGEMLLRIQALHCIFYVTILASNAFLYLFLPHTGWYC